MLEVLPWLRGLGAGLTPERRAQKCRDKGMYQVSEVPLNRIYSYPWHTSPLQMLGSMLESND